MISLDLDLSFLSSQYNIGSSAIQQYQKQNMTITQIMETEAKKGNASAAEFMMRITSNPQELAQLFQLVNPKNRYLILAHMNEQDLMMVMQYLKPEELILGMSVFTQESLVQLMMELPPETLATVVLSKMDSNKFLNSIPEEYMNQFLQSDKIDRGMLMEALENIDDNELQKMMESYSGQPCYENGDSIREQMGSMKDDDLMKAIMSFEPEGKKQLISNLLVEKPELFEEFSPEAMTHPFKSMQKEEILKSFMALDTKEMLPMIEELPQDIMALVATQIDPQVFSEILCSDFADIIAKCGI